MKRLALPLLLIATAAFAGDIILRNSGTKVAPVSQLDCKTDGGLACERSGAIGRLSCNPASETEKGCVDTDTQSFAGYKNFAAGFVGFETDGGSYHNIFNDGDRSVGVGADFVPWTIPSEGATCLFCAPPWITPSLGTAEKPWRSSFINYISTADWNNAPPPLEVDADLAVDRNLVVDAGTVLVGPARALDTKNADCKALTGGSTTATVAAGSKCVCSNSSAATVCKPTLSGTTLTITSGAGTDTVCYLCL